MAGHVEEGWHLYSMSTPAAIPTKVEIPPVAGIEKVRALQPKPVRAFDPNLNSDTETYEGDVAFLFEVELKKDAPAGPMQLDLKARYQTCNPKVCVPSKWNGTAAFTIDPAAAAVAPVIPAGYEEPQAPPPPGATSAPAAPAEGLLAFLAVAFGFGLASIFTPCVFPMIPITMSYFLNRQSGGQARKHRAGAGLLPRHHRAVLRARTGDHRHSRPLRHRAIWAPIPGSTASSPRCSSPSA